jgi:hypothetical protein
MVVTDWGVDHSNALQVDKFALDALNENAEGYMHNLEPWILVCAKHIKKSEPLGQTPLFLLMKNVLQSKTYVYGISQVCPNCGKWIASISL